MQWSGIRWFQWTKQLIKNKKMGDLRPLGSEKLQGMDKIKRILEIAQYKETPKQETNNLSTLDYTIRLADGNIYGIVKEKSGYIIKKGLNESTLDYNEPMKHRKYFRSYSEAMKKLNLVASEMNRLFENDEEIPLIGEQKKKFVLKGPKKEAPAPEPSADLPPAPMDTPPAPMDTPPAPAADPMSSTDAETPTDDMAIPPSDDMGMGDDTDMGGEDLPSDNMDMGGDEDLPAADGDDEEEGDEEPMGLKSIQKLTGKLSQKIRAFDKEQGLDSQDIKYVLNSIISAIDLDSLDEDDKEDILDKLDSTEEGEYGMGGDDLDIDTEDEFDMDLGDDMGSDEEMSSDDMDMEPTPAEEKEGYHQMMDSVFGESKVEKVLSKYFKIDEKEKTILEEKRKRNFLKEKLRKLNVKDEIITMSESLEQKVSALYVLKENKNAKFIGKTNKENLVFNIDGKQVKVTPRGRII
jgi:hypothetical protein